MSQGKNDKKTDCTSNILISLVGHMLCSNQGLIRLFQDLFENTSVDINELTLEQLNCFSYGTWTTPSVSCLHAVPFYITVALRFVLRFEGV